MTNRNILVRVGKHYSHCRPIQNGIPQGSPLSVIIFLIAYNKLCVKISFYKEIDYIAYADDFHLIIKSGHEKNPIINVQGLFRDINQWCIYSGAVLSSSKCKYLHICRKRNCTVSVPGDNNISITQVETLKILGLVINKRYDWNSQIEILSDSLTKQLNIIKCLSSHKFNCNTYTLISIIKALLISKINYSLPFFGYSSKCSLRKIKTKVSSAIRMALGAFRTTPITNMLFESNIIPLEQQRDLLTSRLIKSIYNNQDTPLYAITKKCINGKKIPKIQSVLYKIIELANSLDLPTKTSLPKQKAQPVWHFKQASIDLSLSNFSKPSTDTLIFRKLFLEIRNKYNKYSFIYTDASKTHDLVSYAIVSNSKLIKTAVLPGYTTIFTAEIIAIIEAINSIKTKNGYFALCTDSLSSLKAISNLCNNNTYVSFIRNFLIENFPNVILIWTPGHCGIEGNELADKLAKEAHRSPLLTTTNFNINDLKGFSKSHHLQKHNVFNSTSDWYKTINIDKLTIENFLKNKRDALGRKDYIKFERIRLGHSNLSHGHLIKLSTPQICNCAIQSTKILKHILTSCPNFQTQRDRHLKTPSDALSSISNPTPESILNVISFLKDCKIYNLI